MNGDAMRVLMCGGGTGGHINPAVAIAKAIQERERNAVVEFVGTVRGMETRLVPAAGYKLNTVEVYGLKRKLSLYNIKALYHALTSVNEAKKLVKRFEPDIVIGTGGYASWPTVRAAAKLGIPTLIQEQNAFPGVTTKRLSKYADKVCIAFDESRKFFSDNVKNKLVFTGNPVRANSISRKDARKRLGIADNEVYVLSCGGSLGADRVNTIVLDAMALYSDNKSIRQTHAVGRIGFEKFSAVASEKGLLSNKRYEILEYIYDMPVRQAAADIVISRAGAMTSSELCLLGRATVFIPSPNVAEDHQYKNAMVLKNAGAAEVFRESEIDGVLLAKTVTALAADGDRIKKLETNMRKFGKPDALNDIVNEVFRLIR